MKLTLFQLWHHVSMLCKKPNLTYPGRCYLRQVQQLHRTRTHCLPRQSYINLAATKAPRLDIATHLVVYMSYRDQRPQVCQVTLCFIVLLKRVKPPSFFTLKRTISTRSEHASAQRERVGPHPSSVHPASVCQFEPSVNTTVCAVH